MPVQYLESFFEYFRVRDRILFAYLFISLVLCVLALWALHLRDTVCVILQTLQSASRSEEIAWIQTYNQVESYLAQQSCVMCSSSITYCSKEKCLRDHWEVHHGKECHLLADFKGRKMNHLAQYSKEECKPCEDVGKSTNQASENISPSKQERRSFVNCHSTSEGRYSKGKVAIYCEGVDGVGGIMVKASTPKRVTPSRNRASEHADHGVIPCRYSTFIRSSSSHSTEDSSDSDAMSSLHDLDY